MVRFSTAVFALGSQFWIHAQAAAIRTCAMQAACITWSSDLLSTQCDEGDCTYRVCMHVHNKAGCSATPQQDMSHSCIADPTVCNDNMAGSVETAPFTISGSQALQCQIGAPGTTLSFILKDGNDRLLGCEALTGSMDVGNSMLATCSPRDGGDLSCTGNGNVGKECMWDIVLPDNCPCPPGTVMHNGNCVCPGIQVYQNGQCQCPAGTTMHNGNCVCPGIQVYHNGQCQCPAGTTMHNGNCVCPGIQVYQNGQCQCPSGTQMHNGNCVCPGIQVYHNGQCQCPSGTTMHNGNCVCPGIQVYHNGQCQCPAGTTMHNGNCVCPGIQVYHNGQCQCPSGTQMHNGNCVCPGIQVYHNGHCQCPAGTTMHNGNCVCPGIQVYHNGQCQCPSGTTMHNGNCVCPGGQVFQNSQCQCPGGQVYQNGHCQCPPGQSYIDGACKCPRGHVYNAETQECERDSMESMMPRSVDAQHMASMTGVQLSTDLPQEYSWMMRTLPHIACGGVILLAGVYLGRRQRLGPPMYQLQNSPGLLSHREIEPF